ncbi:hypothetical protein [Acidipropionibacterium thoenii]|uniref:hypothetical protein n=1 Tax=Acidipropionibacterium thoenii TaxID=1751 RepID=UPI0012B61BB3|nr:hypothetical protein [Acidipropionibacterium thoenii]
MSGSLSAHRLSTSVTPAAIPTGPGSIPAHCHPGDHGWVSSLGFGAHLRHLLAVTGLDWRVLAIAAGVSPRTVGRLLGAGRPLRRIRTTDARRLLLLDRDDLALLEARQVGAAATSRRVRALLESGQPIGRVCAELDIGHHELLRLAAGRAAHCSAMVRIRALASCQNHRLWAHVDDEETDEAEEASR